MGQKRRLKISSSITVASWTRKSTSWKQFRPCFEVLRTNWSKALAIRLEPNGKVQDVPKPVAVDQKPLELRPFLRQRKVLRELTNLIMHQVMSRFTFSSADSSRTFLVISVVSICCC